MRVPPRRRLGLGTLLAAFAGGCASTADDDIVIPGGDDDSSALEPGWVVGWLGEEGVLGSTPARGTTLRVALGDGEIPGPLDLIGPDGLPLAGGGLHPAQAATLPDAEGCTVVTPAEFAPWPTSLDRGPLEAAADPATPLSASWAGGAYLSMLDGPAPADDMDLRSTVGDPLATVAGAFDLPAEPTGVLPLPGPVGPLANLQLSWAAQPGSGLEVFAWRLPDLTDPLDWVGVRCVVVDDGSFAVDASALAPAGSGPVDVRLSRVRWRAVADPVLRGWTGASRSLRFELVPG
jgi:hypothetical protein